MEERSIELKYETIDIAEQRSLIEVARDLGRAMTKEEYNSVMLIYKKVLDRVVEEAEKQGVGI